MLLSNSNLYLTRYQNLNVCQLEMRHVGVENNFKFSLSANSWLNFAIFGFTFKNQPLLLFSGVFGGRVKDDGPPKRYERSKKNVKRHKSSCLFTPIRAKKNLHLLRDQIWRNACFQNVDFHKIGFFTKCCGPHSKNLFSIYPLLLTVRGAVSCYL